MGRASDDDADSGGQVTRSGGILHRQDHRPGGQPPLERVVRWLTVVGEHGGAALLYSAAYLAVIATVYVSIVMVLLDLPPNPAPLIGGFVTFAVYANDRLVDLEADELTNPERTAFVKRHRGALFTAAAVAYGVAVTLAVLGGPIPLAVTLVPGILWVLYATDWMPDRWFRIGRLKEVPVVNSIIVAVAWAGAAILLPIGFTGASITTTAAFVLAYFLLRSFANSEIPNVRDIEADRAIGVTTIPVLIGVDRTRWLLYALDLLTAAVVVAGGVTGFLPPVAAVALLVGLGYSLVVTALLGRVERADLLAIAAECEYLVVGLALVPVVY